jgi:hypothetical protein
MKADLITRYTTLREALYREKAQIESRLREIDEALGHSASEPLAGPPTHPTTHETGPVQSKPRGRRPKGTLSLRAAVIQATKDRPLTKPEILRAIFKLGYRTASANPLHALNNLLYGKNPKFANINGRFRPIGVNSTTESAGASALPTPAVARRKFTAAARAKLAAAAKARWARIKKAGGTSLKAGV